MVPRTEGSPCPTSEGPCVQREALSFLFMKSGNGPPREWSLTEHEPQTSTVSRPQDGQDPGAHKHLRGLSRSYSWVVG